MLILMRFFILAFFFLFLNPCNTVNAFGDDWYRNYTDAKPSSPRVPEPEPVEINLHRKTAITSAMPGIITKLGSFKDNDFVGENALLFIVECMKMELAIRASFSGYIMLTPKYKKLFTEMSSKNFSYKNFYPLVDPDDIFFILSEDDETNNQDPLSYNNKNDDDNNKGTPSQPSEPLSETMRDIYLLDQPSKRALVHYLKNPLSERTSNLEETVQTSHSENALQSSSSKKIISKVLELAYGVLPFNILRNQKYKAPFFSQISLTFL